MTSPLDELPQNTERDGMVFGTNRSRLALAMAQTRTPEDRWETTFSESQASLAKYTAGVDNPFGSGLEAYEPNTAMFNEYSDAYNAVQDSKAKEQANADGTVTADFTGGAVLGQADGQIGQAINAALALAQKRVPYVWGGTTSSGVDCSGLIYYAFRAAGIDIPRYRAVDFGKKVGRTVSADEARPGDIVYYDDPGDTDHVGIYLGNGKMVQAPHSGDVVKISDVGKATAFRRLFDDNQFAQIVTPDGGSFWGYGSNGQQWGGTPTTPAPTSITRTYHDNRYA